MAKTTKEERVAIRFTDILSDIRLDLDLIGLYLSRVGNKSFFLRMERILESSEESLKVQRKEKTSHGSIGDELSRGADF